MTDLDQQRLAAWIGDAFAILCVRVSRNSPAECRLRRGFESILRELGTSPLRLIARQSSLPPARRPVTSADLRHILCALDAALGVFDRYAGLLTPAQRRVREHVIAARCHAAEELAAAPQRLAARAAARPRRAVAPRTSEGAVAPAMAAAGADTNESMSDALTLAPATQGDATEATEDVADAAGMKPRRATAAPRGFSAALTPA